MPAQGTGRSLSEQVTLMWMWLVFIGFGFLSGSVMYASVVPPLLTGKDVCQLSDDGNPGAANVFMYGGVWMGMLCLMLDMMKGFVPVCWAARSMGMQAWPFALVMAAPVLGHALGWLNHGCGGKCIATSFGVLAALLPESGMVFLLAAVYILLSTLVKVNPHSRRSIVTFGVLAAGAMLLEGRRCWPVALGCVMIALTVVVKHVESIHALESMEDNGEQQRPV
ncbi:MAG: glycerol-3-phosphate acyltransferase [Aristaeellaceae bacterium]